MHLDSRGGEDLSELEPGELGEYLRALQAERIRLQALVCQLLVENERLRCAGREADSVRE